MKNAALLRLSALLVCLLLTTLAHAQTAPAAAQPGYWNLETNLTTRAATTVRFYNGQDHLIYEETLPGRSLGLSRRNGPGRRATRQLTVALQQVLSDPTANHPAGLLAAQFDRGRRVPRVYAAR